jgi:CRP/FNR family transcriptional regulator, anaerobic regulatory protein
MIEKLLERLIALHKMDAALVDRIREVTRFSTYPKKTFLLRDGQVCDKACMVVSGLARAYYINEDKDITSRFMDEGFIITSWISYYHQKPGDEFIEAIEDTTLACITYADIQQLYKNYPEFNIVGRKQTEYSLYTAEMRTRMLRKHTAEEKYAFFLEQHPDLMNRVSLKYIATYLGMNEETLSRIRSKFRKTGKAE